MWRTARSKVKDQVRCLPTLLTNGTTTRWDALPSGAAYESAAARTATLCADNSSPTWNTSPARHTDYRPTACRAWLHTNHIAAAWQALSATILWCAKSLRYEH